MKIIPRKNNYFVSLFDDDFFNDFFVSPFDRGEKDKRIMKTDIKENDLGYTFEIELPGIKKENVKISAEKGYLTIEANQDYKNEESTKEKYIRKERFSGNYSRTFYIGEVDEKKIDAKFKEGILTLNVPFQKEKKEENKKYIEIK